MRTRQRNIMANLEKLFVDSVTSKLREYMTEKELVAQREQLSLDQGKLRMILDSTNFDHANRKYMAHLKHEIFLFQKQIEVINGEIRELRKSEMSSEARYALNFVRLSKSILDEELFLEISDLARGLS